jgi:hypothetical protein
MAFEEKRSRLAVCRSRPMLWQLVMKMSAGNRKRQRLERIASCSKPLLFAPRLMLERGLKFTQRRSRKSPNDADHPFVSQSSTETVSTETVRSTRHQSVDDLGISYA